MLPHFRYVCKHGTIFLSKLPRNKYEHELTLHDYKNRQGTY